MNQRWITNVVLLLIAVSLLAIVLRPYLRPEAAQAQSGTPYPLYIEPGTPDAARAGRQQTGAREGSDRYAERECLGLSDHHDGHLSSQRDELQAAGFASVSAGQVCV